MSDLTKELRDKTRLRKTHGLSGWVLHEEGLTDKAADEIDRLTADLAAANAEIARLKIKLEADAKLGHESEDEITALRAEVSALKEDAERYRWLRDNKLVYRTHPIADGWTMDEVIYDTAEQGPDAAIDNARKP